MRSLNLELGVDKWKTTDELSSKAIRDSVECLAVAGSDAIALAIPVVTLIPRHLDRMWHPT